MMIVVVMVVVNEGDCETGVQPMLMVDGEFMVMVIMIVIVIVAVVADGCVEEPRTLRSATPRAQM